MDVSVRQQLSDLVEELTHSGAPSLDETLLKKLKRICKLSDDNIQTTYSLIMSNMAKKHAEVRLSAFQIAAELFPRSHLFRLLLTSDFQRLTQLVTGTDPKHPLPLPRPAASRLKESSLLAIRQWHEKFGDGYPKLKIGYNYLKHSKKVDFDGLVAQTEAVRRQNEARVARRTAFAQQRLKEIHTEVTDQKQDIDACLKQMESCFNLLLPQFGVSEEEQPFIGGVVRTPSGGQGQFRNRTLSSGSFASLGDMECSSSEGEGEERKEEEMGGTCIELREGEGQEEQQRHLPELAEEGGKRELLEPGRDSRSENHHRSDVTEKKDGEGTRVECEMTTAVSQAHEKRSQLSETIESAPLLPLATPCDLPPSDLLSVYGTATGGGRKGKSGDKGKGKGKEREGPGDGGKKRGEEEYNVGSSSSDDSDVEWEEVPPASSTLQEHGFVGHGVSIPIELSAQIVVEENEDNSSILTALSESLHLLQDKYLPSVNKWLEWLTKAGGESDLKEAIDLKNRILTALEKYKKLTIKFRHPKQTAVQHKTRDEAHSQPSHPRPSPSQLPPVTAHPLTQGSGFHFMRKERAVELEQDPTTVQAQLRVMRKSLTHPTPATKTTTTKPPPTTPSSSSSSHSQAPVLPFDMDLYHWGSSDGAAPVVNKIRMTSVHQYWGSDREVELCDDEKALSKCRTILFAGKFEPVKWSCRAPLPSGKLCPRRDRLKCPFHGPIIPRDEHGNPVNTTPTATPQPPTTSEKDFNDIEAAVFAAKGIELPKKGKKGKRGRQKKHPGLTDLAAHSNTSRRRLERKILSKKALRRVADVMDGISAKRFRDKFADSFNYALKD